MPVAIIKLFYEYSVRCYGLSQVQILTIIALLFINLLFVFYFQFSFAILWA